MGDGRRVRGRRSRTPALLRQDSHSSAFLLPHAAPFADVRRGLNLELSSLLHTFSSEDNKSESILAVASESSTTYSVG